MATSKKYINPNYPVYISYAWSDERSEYQNLEDHVNKLCDLMESNNIFYLRDKSNGANSLCPYRRSILDAEKEIGQGEAVVAVLSDKYLRSIHCLNEWYYIMENGKVKDRVFPIVLNTPIDNGFRNIKKTYDDYFDYWETDAVPKLRQKLYNRNTTRLNESERWIIGNDEPWRPILHNIYDLITQNITPKYETTSEAVYSDVIVSLKEYLIKLEDKNPLPKQKQKSRQWLLIPFIAILLAAVIIWTKPWKGGNEQIETQTEEPAIEQETEWTTSDSWPFGKWQGGSKYGKPHGPNVTVLYRMEHEYSTKDPLKRKSKEGHKVVGMFEDGNLIIGDIYDQDGNLVEHNFEPKL